MDSKGATLRKELINWGFLRTLHDCKPSAARRITASQKRSMSRRRRSKTGKMALATHTRATSNGLPSTSK
nr:MAG TPA: hypothetical protein [Caudoviricetes sp.]